jgi:DNA-directed RNA polymerase sigma subunit (sigma70/sigma32)
LKYLSRSLANIFVKLCEKCRVYSAIVKMRRQGNYNKPGATAPGVAWSYTLEEIAAQSGTTVAEVSRTLSARLNEFCPDSLVTEGGSGWDVLAQELQVSDDVAERNADSREEREASYVELQELSWSLELPHVLKIVNDVVDSMPEKQAQVLVLAYGLKGEEKLTLKEIAKRTGMKGHGLVKYHLQKARDLLIAGLLQKHAIDFSDL